MEFVKRIDNCVGKECMLDADLVLIQNYCSVILNTISLRLTSDANDRQCRHPCMDAKVVI